MYNPPKVASNAKARREAKGYTIAELARIAGVSDATIKRAEQGNPVRSDIFRWIEEGLDG